MPRDAVHYIKEAQRARRQGRADEERAQLTAVLEAAVDASMASEKLAATAHLAVLDGDHEAALTATGELIKIDPAHAYAPGIGMAVAEAWPAPPRACETHLCARAMRFREFCQELPRDGEIAVELGAAHGLATKFLARKCGMVYGIEKSPQMAEVARNYCQYMPNVRVLAISSDSPGAVLVHAPRADLVFVDIGGSTPVKKVMHAARMYRELYQPRVLVIRCVYLSNFVAGLASSEPAYGPTIWADPNLD
ncbi:MAG TPA: hypothetical protein QGH10_03880 [Armatimonadota bacterium]|nr:hypothetical protein [Armatimonadota bacterium]